jgi:hypothetical protein
MIVVIFIFQITRSKEDDNFSFDNTETKKKKIKRGVFIFIGSASMILFGTLSDEDTTYYQIKISELETEKLSMLKVAKQQMIVVCTTSETVKSTLANVAANEMQLSKNLNVMQKKTNENGEKTNQASPQATF